MAEKDTKSKSKTATTKSASASVSKSTAAKPKTTATAKSAPTKQSEKTSAKSATKQTPQPKTKTSEPTKSAKPTPTTATSKSVKEAPKAKADNKSAKTVAPAQKTKNEPAKAEKAKTAEKVAVKQKEEKPKVKIESKAEKATASKIEKQPIKEEKNKSKDSAKPVEEKPSKSKAATKSAEEEVLAASAKGKTVKEDSAKTEKAKTSSKTDKNEKAEKTAKSDKEETKSQSKNKEKNELKQPDKKEKSKDKQQKDKKSKGEGKNKKTLIIGIVSGVLILAIIIGIIIGVKSCSNAADAYQYEYKNSTVVGFSSKELSTVKRVKPISEVRNEGFVDQSLYPKYGYTPNNILGDANSAARTKLIRESSYLTATGTSNAGGGGYTWMDAEGKLYSGTTAEPIKAMTQDGSKQRQLYKHTSSVGLYYGDVSDSEPGRVKELTFRPRSYTRGYNVTGLYAPAGEVIKIQISEKDMEATNGITIHIGQALYNGKANNIWAGKNKMQRFPVILNTMSVTKSTATLENGVYTAYVGSFLGGPIYIRNESVTFKATISGGVNYSHFILGYTTEDEFNKNAQSSAPYFDMEVWDNGVLHSGPKTYAKSFTYNDIYKAAVLWEKVSLVTTTGSNQGIVFLYDPFVAAGAAVAFPGQGSVNCPTGWMKDSLNYKTITTSGSWGNFHEYHHNFQGYGVGNGGEVTNNGMTLVSYALFTKISSARGIGSYGAEGLGSAWNRYTSATWALEDVLKISRGGEPSNGKKGLALYATLLHNFGPDNYIQSKVRQQSQKYGESYVGYLKAWQDITHNDMTYYFKDILQGITDEQAKELSNPEYSMFVPVSSVYQTGRSYMYDGEKKYITTMQPYVITYGDEFTFDLNKYTVEDGRYKSGSINLPDGFSFKVKDVKQPQYGKLTAQGNNIYKYAPDKKNLRSGDIIVTLEITKDGDPSFKVDDVDLVLEFEQTHEKNKFTLERTTYTYDASNMYTDAVEAYNNGYANYTSKVDGDNLNGTQNSNTDIWYYSDTDEKYKDSPYKVQPNSVAEVRGKLYFQDAGKYRLYLRGRSNCAMYYSIGDESNYQLGGTIKKLPNNSAQFQLNDSNTYVDIEVGAESWVYFKTVLIVQKNPAISYIGLGLGQWTEPMFTIQEVKDELGNVIGTKYYNYLGQEVSEEEANNAELIAPTKASYATAYRSSYEFPKGEFESDYFYTRKYNYDYYDEAIASDGKTHTPTSDCNYVPWTPDLHSISNLFDGNLDTVINFSKDWGVSESKPAILAFDIGEEISANSLTLHALANYSKHIPKDMVLQGSVDGTEYFYMGSWTNVSLPKGSTKLNLKFIDGKAFTFRYYRLKITATESGRCAFSDLSFSNLTNFVGNGNNLFSPDNDMFKFSKKWKAAQAYSTFGHVYAGKKGDTMEFEFEGTNFVILSSSAYANEFEVKIDGNVVESLALKSEKDEIYASYLSQVLASGKHKVQIKCKGKASIDSIAIYDVK